jgi:GrpB-like predicted nucleotidyltransferase (UPF0157 family)
MVARAVVSRVVEGDAGIVVVAADPDWAQEFAHLGERLRGALGGTAVRIDHIGSTAVAGLDAKPVIDVQVSVAALDPLDAYRVRLERVGFIYRADNPERTKRYFRELPGDKRTHIHVRRAGSFSEQFALLFRDFLRADAARASQYAAVKHALAARYARPEERHQYVEAKAPFIWDTMRLADDWAQMTGWEPGPSDA